MREHALQYAARGWRVFRLLPGSKFPFKGSHGFKDGTVDANVIDRWWSQTPEANIGLATGYAGEGLPNLVVFDCDGPEGLEEFKRVCAPHGGIPPTLSVKTSNGWHFYYQCPPGVRIRSAVARRAVKGGPGLDIKADKAYVVLPPSLNSKTGFVYQWANDRPIMVMSASGGLVEVCRARVAASRRGPGPNQEPAFGGQAVSDSFPAFGGQAGKEGGLSGSRRLAERALSVLRQGELGEFLRALGRIKADCGYDQWFELGAAIHDFDPSPAGLEIFKRWSWSADGYRTEADVIACERKWIEYAIPKPGVRLITKASIYALSARGGQEASKQEQNQNASVLQTGQPHKVNGVAALPAIFSAVEAADPIFVDLDKNRLPRSTCTNAGIAILALRVECRNDCFHERMTVAGHEVQAWAGDLSDAAVLMLRKIIKHNYGFDPGSNNTLDATVQLCLEHQFNPVIEYLDGLKWDGRARIGRWVADYLGASDTPLNKEFGRLMLIAAVRRARKPGTKFDQIVVLEGIEGTGKSTAVKILAGEDNFSDQNILAASDKEQQEAFRGVWLHEIAELAGMKRTEVERVKQFCSRTEDRARPAYGRVRVDMKRRGIFVATTNDEEYLKSQTGNRRFWPIRTGAIDLVRLAADRDQLWAEAVNEEKQGGSIELKRDYRALAAEEQEKRTEKDPWVGLIWSKLNPTNGAAIDIISVTDLLNINLGIPLTQIRQAELNRAARALKQIGFYRHHDRVENGFKWVYKRFATGHKS